MLQNILQAKILPPITFLIIFLALLHSPGISPASSYFFSLSNTIGFRSSIHPPRYRIPEFDNRIWPPFAERAYVRSADMQMIAVGCIERDASGRVATVGNPWSWRSEVGSAVLRRHLTTVENASPFGVCFREEKR